MNRKKLFSIILSLLLSFQAISVYAQESQDSENPVTNSQQQDDAESIEGYSLNEANASLTEEAYSEETSVSRSIADLAIFTREIPITEYYSKADYDDNFRYDYYFYNQYLYILDLETNQMTKIEDRIPAYNITDIVAKGNMIYIGVPLNGHQTVKIYGFDTIQKQITYEQEFPVSQSINERFAIDNNGNFYFTEDPNEIRIYSSVAVLLDSMSSDASGITGISLNNISPNDKLLFYDGNYRHEGYIVLNGAKFKDKQYHLSYLNRTPTWKFVNNTVAVNQYGEIAQFDFKNEGSDGSYHYNLLYTAASYTDLIRPAAALMNNTTLLMGAGKGRIIEYDFSNRKVLKYLEIGEDKEITQIDYSTGILYVQYTQNEKKYISKYKEADFVETQKITINIHSALQHSEADVVNAWRKATNVYDYSKGVYATTPSWKAPYKAGSLKQEVISDTLNQLNYLRWLAGLNAVTLNKTYMDRSQKGAVLMRANDELTHYPVKPADMSDDFYSEGAAGVGAGYDYSGNIAYGYSMPDAIQGYTDDDYNMMGGVGHRLSMLDPNAVSTSFGYAEGYDAVSIYTTANQTVNNDAFYAWPAPGYFPVESISADAMWNIQVMDPYEITKSSIVITYNGKNYNATNYRYDSYYKSLCFDLPDDLKDQVTSNYQYKASINLVVTLYHVEDDYGNSITIQYPVKFISAANSAIPLAAVTDLKAKSVGTRSIQLTWGASGGADGYLIYSQNSKKKYSYCGMVSSNKTSYIDTNAQTGEYNYYWVFPYKEVNGKKIVGQIDGYTYATAIPATATNIKAAAEGASIKLTWNKVSDVDGYIIYRQLPGEKNMSYRYTVTGTGFVDNTAQLDDYNFYRIYPYKRVNGKNIIAISDKYVYEKPKLTNVANLKAIGKTNKQIQVSWNSYGGADGYLVYRQDPGTKQFTYRTMTASTGFVDQIEKAGEYYYYRVYPYKNSNGKRIIGTSNTYVYAKSK